MDKLAYTVEEAARLLGIGRSAAYEGVRTGQIPSIRIGRRILAAGGKEREAGALPKAALEQMLDLTVGAPDAETHIGLVSSLKATALHSVKKIMIRHLL